MPTARHSDKTTRSPIDCPAGSRRPAGPARAVRLPLIVFLLLLTGCAPSPQPPDIVIITLDTTRADHLGCYGYFRDTTPRIDEFAAECVLFENCLAPVPQTLPSHTSLFTPTYPIEHGVMGNVRRGGYRFVRSEKLRTWAGFVREEGYRTGAFVSAAAVSSRTGLSEGYETFDDRCWFSAPPA